jgi:hypothetical protein
MIRDGEPGNKDEDNPSISISGEGSSRGGVLAAELHEQFEQILDQVWRCEADWRFDDRLNLAVRGSQRRGG